MKISKDLIETVSSILENVPDVPREFDYTYKIPIRPLSVRINSSVPTNFIPYEDLIMEVKWIKGKWIVDIPDFIIDRWTEAEYYE